MEDQIESLEDDWYLGLSIEGHPGLRYHIMKRRPGGDGHIALYLVEEDRVLVLRVFHTKQDWQGSL